MARKLHLFDLDKTLITCNSSFAFGKFLYHNRFFSFSTMVRVVATYTRHSYFGLSIQKVHERIFSRIFYHRHQSDVDKYIHPFIVRYISGLIYPPAVSALKQAVEVGDYVVILSSGPHFLIEPIAKYLGAHQGFGTEYLTRDGRYERVGNVLEGEQKAKKGEKIREALGISKENVLAYSDSWLDIPLLESVGNPIGVNPDDNLKAVCHAKKWRII